MERVVGDVAAFKDDLVWHRDLVADAIASTARSASANNQHFKVSLVSEDRETFVHDLDRHVAKEEASDALEEELGADQVLPLIVAVVVAQLESL